MVCSFRKFPSPDGDIGFKLVKIARIGYVKNEFPSPDGDIGFKQEFYEGVDETFSNVSVP